MKLSLAELRREYSAHGLLEEEMDPDPLVQFKRWFEDILNSTILEPNAMILATSTPDGIPSARVVLLKGFDESGYLFFTNYESRKAQELALNPRAALVFYWPEVGRQVRLEGRVEKASMQESEAYFRTRPRESRIGAWASRQSSVLPDRKSLEERFNQFHQRYPGEEIPLPPFWGGYRVVPHAYEFWQGRENRLHDRIAYIRQDHLWRMERLSP
jgi:pyridoxamine 5'-phosphate oxidase